LLELQPLLFSEPLPQLLLFEVLLLFEEQQLPPLLASL
jgi:hypothetical protein